MAKWGGKRLFKQRIELTSYETAPRVYWSGPVQLRQTSTLLGGERVMRILILSKADYVTNYLRFPFQLLSEMKCSQHSTDDACMLLQFM